MSRYSKLLQKILSARSDSNISFTELRNLLKKLGFNIRIKGDHHIFHKETVDEIINLQPIGTKAKAYQIRQVRNIIVKYKMGEIDAEKI